MSDLDIAASPAQEGCCGHQKIAKKVGFVALNLHCQHQPNPTSNPAGAQVSKHQQLRHRLCFIHARTPAHTPLGIRFLCGRLEWTQGDFVDDAGLGSDSGFGTDSGLASGRHVRYNYDNYTKVGVVEI